MTSKHEMSFLSHLAELRERLGKSLLGVFICSVLAFIFAGELFSLLTAPLRNSFEGVELIGTGPAEAFLVKLKVSLASGTILASPIIFYQLWCFITPALNKKERRYALPFVFLSSLFFLIGISFCFQIIFPHAFQFFGKEFLSIGISPTIKIGEYLSFAVKLLFVFGIVFELPVLSFLLARLGLLTHTWLISQFRYGILTIFILAAIFTPPDIATQVLLALPLILLYSLCIAITYLAHPKTP